MSKYLEHLEFNGTDILLRDAEARGLIQENTNEIASVKAKANLNEQKIGALTPRVTAAEEDIIALDGRLDTAEDDIDSLELHMSAAEDDIDSLEDRATSLEGTVDSLGDRMTTAEGDIDALEGRMDTAEGDIDNLEDAVDQHADLIDGLSDDVTALEGRMDAVETKNDAQDDKLDELDRKIAASTYEAGIGIYFGQGVDHTNINVEDELITELHNATSKNIEQDTRLTNIENGTTKLPYGKSLSVTPDGNNKNLNLLDPNNNVLSSVQLPKSGTQLKYDDEGTLTNIDEATLGTGLEYDDQTDTINCTVEPGTKVFPKTATVTPLEVQITAASTWTSGTSVWIEPTTIYIPSTSTTINTAADFDTFIASIHEDDVIALDFTAVSSIINSIPTTQSTMALVYNHWSSNPIYILDCTSADIANMGYITPLEVFNLYQHEFKVISKYNQLYIGEDFKVENDILKLASHGIKFYNTRFVGDDSQNGEYPAIYTEDLYDLSDLNKYPIGTEIQINGTDGTLSTDYYRARLGYLSLDFFLFTTTSHYIIKRWLDNQYNTSGSWQLVHAEPGVDAVLDSSWNDENVLETTAIALIGNYANQSHLIKAPFNTALNKPKYVPYDGSTVTTPDYCAVAENDKYRAEIFIYSNSYPASYDNIKPYNSNVGPYVPKFISSYVYTSDSSNISKNLAPAIPNADGSYSVSGTPLSERCVTVIYDKI